MIGFLIRKNFYDVWDNLFRVVLVNLGFIISVAVTFLFPTFVPGHPEIGIPLLVLGGFWCCIYLTMASLAIRKVSDYSSFGFADFFGAFREALPAGLLLGAIVAAMGFLAVTAIPFYLSQGSLFGLFAAALVFWTLLVVSLALQFYLPIRARLDTKLSKVVKKCFIVFFDNPGLALFCAIHNILFLSLSVFVAWLAPGPAGALLFTDEALRLRLMKYDWLELNPDANRKKIPWEELLVEEREKTGTRSLKNFFFPWKY